jgi:hypothetical protein
MYSSFIENLNGVIRDGEIDEEEIRELRCWGLKLALVSSGTVTSQIATFVEQAHLIHKFRYLDLTEEERALWRQWFIAREGKSPVPEESDGDNKDFVSIGTLLFHLKHDLGEASISADDQAFASGIWVDRVLDFRSE